MEFEDDVEIVEVIPVCRVSTPKRTRPMTIISLAEPSTSRVQPPPPFDEEVIDLCEDETEPMDLDQSNDDDNNAYGIQITKIISINNMNDINSMDDIEDRVNEMNLSDSSSRSSFQNPTPDPSPPHLDNNDNNVVSDDDDGFEEEFVGHEVVDNRHSDDAVVDVLSANKIRHIRPEFLMPFDYGWKREVVMRGVDSNLTTPQFDVYYWPPERGAAKCRSKPDLVKHFAKYYSNGLTTDNFLYNRKPLGLNNPECEIIRRCLRDSKTAPKNSKKIRKR